MWTPQKLAAYNIKNYEAQIKNNSIQKKANKEGLEEQKKFRRLPKIPLQMKVQKIPKENINDYMYESKLNRIGADSKLSEIELQYRNSNFLTPVDKEMVQYYNSKIQSVNPDVLHAPQPRFHPIPKTNAEFTAENPSLNNSKFLKELEDVNNDISDVIAKIDNDLRRPNILLNTYIIKEKQSPSIFNRAKILNIKKEIQKIENEKSNELNILIPKKEAIENRLEQINEERRKLIEEQIKPYNVSELNKYERHILQNSSSNVSLQRLPNESDEDYIKRTNIQLEAQVLGDQKQNMNVYYNKEFINLLENAGISRNVVENINNQIDPKIKMSILKTKKLFVDELNKIKTEDLPLYKLTTKDVKRFIEYYQSRNPISYSPIVQAPPNVDISIDPTNFLRKPILTQSQNINNEDSPAIPDVVLTSPSLFQNQTLDSSPYIPNVFTSPPLFQNQTLDYSPYNPDIVLGTPVQTPLGTTIEETQYETPYEEYEEDIEPTPKRMRDQILSIPSKRELNRIAEKLNIPDYTKIKIDPLKALVIKKGKRAIEDALKAIEFFDIAAQLEHETAGKPGRPVVFPPTPTQNITQGSETGQGLRRNKNKRKKGNSKLNDVKERLELIGGEIIAGNTNKLLLKEAAHILRELYRIKAIDKKGAEKYYNQLKNYN